MAYTRIPSANTTRNENQLRANVDGILSVDANTLAIADKMGQMNADGGADRIAAEYNIVDANGDPDPAEANAIYSLYASLANEIREQSPFRTQVKQRLG